jgi:hypothetical protein
MGDGSRHSKRGQQRREGRMTKVCELVTLCPRVRGLGRGIACRSGPAGDDSA